MDHKFETVTNEMLIFWSETRTFDTPASLWTSSPCSNFWDDKSGRKLGKDKRAKGRGTGWHGRGRKIKIKKRECLSCTVCSGRSRIAFAFWIMLWESGGRYEAGKRVCDCMSSARIWEILTSQMGKMWQIWQCLWRQKDEMAEDVRSSTPQSVFMKENEKNRN